MPKKEEGFKSLNNFVDKLNWNQEFEIKIIET